MKRRGGQKVEREGNSRGQRQGFSKQSRSRHNGAKDRRCSVSDVFDPFSRERKPRIDLSLLRHGRVSLEIPRVSPRNSPRRRELSSRGVSRRREEERKVDTISAVIFALERSRNFAWSFMGYQADCRRAGSSVSRAIASSLLIFFLEIRPFEMLTCDISLGFRLGLGWVLSYEV